MHLIRSRQYQVFRHCPYQLTPMEGQIVEFFGCHPGATLSALAEETGRDKGQLARLIKALREYGLLTPAASGPDKRAIPLQLSREGEKVRRVLREELEEATALAVSDFNASDRTLLFHLLTRLRTNLGTEAGSE